MEIVSEEQDAMAEAAHWHARLQGRSISLATVEEFFAWRRIPEHASAWRALCEFHERAEAIAGDPAIREATEAAFGRPLRRRRKLIAGGVAAALVAASGFLFFARPWASQTYSTERAEIREIALADGSRVTLDADTHLKVRYTKDARLLSLDSGRAFFAVAHNPDRPFVVMAGLTRVTATGTQFDVRRTGDQTDVALIEGGVDVATEGRVSHLNPGQGLSVAGQAKPLSHRVDLTAARAWTTGWIVLDDVPLSDAIGQVNRYTKRPVTLDAQRYAATHISGTFVMGDIPSFIAAVTAILPLRVAHNDDGSYRLTE